MTIDLRRIFDRIERNQDAIVELARRLVAVPTENPPGNRCAECIALLTAELERLGLPHETVGAPSAAARSRLTVVSGVGQGPTFYLHGHYDVVPGSGPRQFSPTVVDGRLIGRGAADMKGALAAMIYALAALREEELPGRVELVMVPDEETGGALGAGYLSELGRLGRNGVGAIVGEPTGGAIWNANRGAITLRVRLRGKPAHVGLQHEGRNAFEAALPILAALAELKERVERRHTAYFAEPDQARGSILMIGGEVSGARQFNVVPASFSFSVERRFNPEEDLEVEKARLLETIREAAPAGINLDIEVIQEGAASSTSADSPLARALVQAIEAVGAAPQRFELCPGLLETRFYGARGVDALAYGPGLLSVSHGPAEYVELQRVFECAKVYAATAVQVLAGKDAARTRP